MKKIHPFRTSAEFLADILKVPSKEVYDAAAWVPKLLTKSIEDVDLLVRFKDMGMPSSRIMRRYPTISWLNDILPERLDRVEELLGDEKEILDKFMKTSAIFNSEEYFQSHLSRMSNPLR